MIWERLFLSKSTTKIHYLHITTFMIKSVFFWTILIHISTGLLLISSFKHLKDERNTINSTVPLYLHTWINLLLLLLFPVVACLPSKDRAPGCMVHMRIQDLGWRGLKCLKFSFFLSLFLCAVVPISHFGEWEVCGTTDFVPVSLSHWNIKMAAVSQLPAD